MIIEHTFVINLKHRTDRWNKIKENFKNLKLKRWEAVYGKKLSDTNIQNIANEFCYNFCSEGMIGCWLSHYNLWKYIVSNKLDNVLILEDDSVPTENFKNIDNLLTSVPSDYDLFYLGCDGSCDNKNNSLLKLYFGENKTVNQDIMIPSFPLATHAYILSHKGAQKLLNNSALEKVGYHIDYYLAKYVYNNNNNNFKVYAVREPFIVQSIEENTSDVIDSNHFILDSLFSNIKFSNSHNMDYFMNTKLLHFRSMNVSLTWYFILFAILSFIVGYFGSNTVVEYYIYLIIIVLLVETALNNSSNKNYSRIMIELLVIFIFLYVGSLLNK